MKYRTSFFAGVICFAATALSGAQVHAQSLPSAELKVTAQRTVPANGDDNGLTAIMRLETVGYRLATANPDTCAKPVMRTGLFLYDLAGYSEAQRAVISGKYLGNGFGVLGVVPGSVGEQAGLQVLDEILAVNGSDVTAWMLSSFGRTATYARKAAFIDFLAAQLAQGPATLLVRRGTDRLTLTLNGLPGCGGYVQAIKSGVFNAWSDGKGVAVTTQMINFTDSDDKLAFIVAHEMAHNVLGHNENRNALSTLLSFFGLGLPGARRHEITADQFAVHLVARTAYNKDEALALLTRLNNNWLLKLNFDLVHPTFGYRIALTKAAIAREDSTVTIPSSAAANLTAQTTQSPLLARLDADLALAPIRLNVLSDNNPMQAANWLRDFVVETPLPKLEPLSTQSLGTGTSLIGPFPPIVAEEPQGVPQDHVGPALAALEGAGNPIEAMGPRLNR